MIEFMVISAPRSASTWVSNWLTTDTTLCMHEPLWKMRFADLDGIQSTKMLGLAETGIKDFHKHLATHPARKVILHRDLKECSDSLVNLGFQPMTEAWVGALEKIDGMHCHWSDVFDEGKAREIYEFLLQREFDVERWRWIKEIAMQPHFTGLTINKEAAHRLLAELRAADAG